MRKKLLSFHCECSLQRNSIDIPLPKTKSKLKSLHLYAYYENESLAPNQVPYIQISDLNSEESILYKFSILLIKKILRPFILEGKITIEIMDENSSSSQNSRIVNASDMSLKDSIKVENSILIFISQSSQEMLSHFCQLLNELHMKIKALKANTAKDHMQNNKGAIINNNEQKLNANIKNQGHGHEETKRNIEINGRKKINREILSHQNQKTPINNQISNKDPHRKRNFNCLKENTMPALKPIPKGTSSLPKVSMMSKQFFENIPEIILEKIIDFLPRSDFFKKLILLNKDFYRLVWKNIRHLNLNSKPEIPPNMLRKFLNQLQSVNQISFGRLKNINPGFLAEVLSLKFPLCLKEVDLSRYSKTNDKILIKMLLNCKGLVIIRLPYLGQLTKDSLLTINTYLKTLRYLDLRYDGSTAIQANINITDMSLINVIEKNTEIAGFNFAYLSNVFLENFFKEKITESLISRLRVIKITNVVLVNNLSLLENLRFLKSFTNLEYLKILNIVFKNQYNKFEPLKIKASIFELIIKGCSKLNKIKFGAWCDNEMVVLLAENLKGLQEVSFKNNQDIEDTSMEILLNSLGYLEKLDISECTRLNGHCLEGIISEKLMKLVVSYDDFNLKCTEVLLRAKGLMSTRLINKVAKKKI